MNLNDAIVQRQDRIIKRLESVDVDAFISFHPANRQYLSGFTGSSGYVVLTRSGKKALFTDWRYLVQAAAEAPTLEHIEFGKDKSLWDAIQQFLQEAGAKRLGFESQHANVKWMLDGSRDTNLEFVPTFKIVEAARQIKDDYELDRLRAAQVMADQVLEHIFPLIRPGMRELDLAIEMRHKIELLGGLNYPGMPIVASGARAALPHGRASEKKLEQGDFVLFDFGANVAGYLSDTTRMAICGQPSAKQREVFDLVLQAEEAGLQLIGGGVTGQAVDRVCRQPLHDAGYGHVTHGYSVGHGIGLEVHEDPFLSEGYTDQLLPNMVVTVEPGIYIPGWGGVRVEDTVIIKEDGCEILNRFPRGLHIV